MKTTRLLVHALAAEDVAQLAEGAGLYQPADQGDPNKPRKPLRLLDTGGKRYLRVFELERHPDGALILTARGDDAVRWAQSVADVDALAQAKRKAERMEAARREQEARLSAEFARQDLVAAQAFAESMGADPTPGAVTVTISDPGPSTLAGDAAAALIEAEEIEPPTPPATPTSKLRNRKRS